MKCKYCKYVFKLESYTTATDQDVLLECPKCFREFTTPRFRLVWKRDDFSGTNYCTVMDLIHPTTDTKDFDYYDSAR